MALFAHLTASDYGDHGASRAASDAERDRLWELCGLVIAEVRKTDGPRSEIAIAAWLMEMRQIVKRKKRRR